MLRTKADLAQFARNEALARKQSLERTFVPYCLSASASLIVADRVAPFAAELLLVIGGLILIHQVVEQESYSKLKMCDLPPHQQIWKKQVDRWYTRHLMRTGKFWVAAWILLGVSALRHVM